MREARERSQWLLASVVAAASFNANPFLREHAKPEDFNAYERAHRKPGSLDLVIGQMARDGFFEGRPGNARA